MNTGKQTFKNMIPKLFSVPVTPRLGLVSVLALLLSCFSLTAHADSDEPEKNASGYYEISTAAQLKWFSDRVAKGYQSINGVLTDDIDLSGLGAEYWQPIGLLTESSESGMVMTVYTGKFDGQGHTVSGLVLRKSMASGLFGYVKGGTISNITVYNAQMKTTLDETIASVQFGIGSICGLATEGTVIDNCHSTKTEILYKHYNKETQRDINYVGGIVGALRSSTVKNCTVDGFVRTDGDYVGGIAGFLDFSKAIDCHLKDYDTDNSAVVGTDHVGGITGYLQNIPLVDAIVDCTVADGSIVNATEGKSDLICATDTFLAEPSAENGYYLICTVDQFKWFALQVYKGNTTIKAKLGANLNMSKAGSFIPMGTESSPFAGEFDGQEYTIDSLTISNRDYAGLFGFVKDGVIKNLNLTNPTLKTYNQKYLGIIAGWLSQNSGHDTPVGYIENCHVTNGQLVRYAAGDPKYVGGIVGKVDMSAEVRNCTFQGEVTAHEDYIGGIAGCLDSGGKLYNCSTLGPSKIHGDDYVGGVVGYMVDTETLINNCFADQSTGEIIASAEGGGYAGLIRGYDKSGSVTNTKYNEGGLQYELTGKTITVEGNKTAKETKITGVATTGQGTYYACVDIGSSGNNYFNTEIESVAGAEELYFWDNISNLAGTKACNWISMKIDDYAFGNNFKSLKMYYKMFAGDDHVVMLRPTDVYPVGENMLGNCPDAKVYVDAEYYEEFCNDEHWSKYKKYLVPVTSMRTEDVNALYGGRYAYDRNRDKTGSIVEVDNGSLNNCQQVHVIGADDSYLTADNNYTLWIYQDIGETYDYNTTKVWAASFKGKDNIHSVKFQEITKSAKRASMAFNIAIGDSAFANCKNLTIFDVALYSDDDAYHTEFIKPSQMPIGKGVFDGCPNVKIFVPESLVEDFKNDTVYGWNQYKDIIYKGEFGHGDFTELGVVYTYYTSEDGKTRYTSANNAPMEELLASWVSEYRNFVPSKVLQYNHDKVKYLYASGIDEKGIEDQGGKLCIYSDIAETLPNRYKTVALSASGFQGQKSIKKIIFEDMMANNYNTVNDFTLVIPDRCFADCSELKELTLFYLCTKGTNHYVAFKPSQIFIGEHVFDGVNSDFRIRVLPEYYADFINDPNWSQYKDLIVASDYLPTTEKAKVIYDVTYDYATKIMDGMTANQVVQMKSSWWNAVIIAAEVILTIATAGTNHAGTLIESAQAPLWRTLLSKITTSVVNEVAAGAGEAAGEAMLFDLVNGYALNGLGNALAQSLAALDAGIIVGANANAFAPDVPANYIANRAKKIYERPSTWTMNGQWLSREDVKNVPHMYVADVPDKEIITLYNDIGTNDDDYQTVAIARAALHNKKKLKTLKFQERLGEDSRSLAQGMTLALPDSMFVGCDNFETLDLINYTTGAHNANHAFKSLTPDNFIPLGDIFAGIDTTKVHIRVGEDVIDDFLEDPYWSKYKDMFVTDKVEIKNAQTEWSCKYALAYDKNTLPLRTTVSTHDIDHVMIYGADETLYTQNEGLAALLNDYGNWNNYKLDYVMAGAFKGNENLKILDICDTHTNTSKVYTAFDVILQDSAFAHCPNFTDLNLIYQVTVGDNHTESMSPSQFLLGDGVFDDTPKLKIKFCLDQEEAFLADTAWVKYKDKFAPCFFEPVDEKVGKILLHPYRFLTKLNDGTNFEHVDASRAKPEDLKSLFKGKDIESFNEFRAFSACGLTEVYDDMFSGCSKLQSIMLPDSITSIGSNAFKDCSLLYNLTIPAKVDSIKENAFTGSGIKTFTVKSAVPADIDAAKVFAGLTDSTTYIIYVPDSVVDTYKTKWSAVADHINGVSGRGTLKVVKLDKPGTLAEKLGLNYVYTENLFFDNHLYGNYAQYDSLRIIGPIDGRDVGVIRYMGGRDVEDCDPTVGHLKYLDLYEAELKSEGAYTYNRGSYETKFWQDHRNNKIEDDNSVDEFMFFGLDKLETLILPKTATIIKKHAMRGCTNLKYLVIGDNMAEIERDVAGETNNKVALVMLSDKVPDVDYRAFALKETIDMLGTAGIYNQTNQDETRFSAIIVPGKSIDKYASTSALTLASDSLIANFEDEGLVEALKKAHIFSVVDLMTTRNIKGMVYNNSNIRKFNELYYSSVTELGDSTLTDMDNLKEVTLPIALRKITKKAFDACYSLKNIYAFGLFIPQLEEDAFIRIPEDFIVWVPEGTEDAYRKAWYQYKDHIQGYRSARVDIREITLTEPNTLADSLKAKITMKDNMVIAVGGNLSDIRGLKINGPIGGKDIALIRYLGGREPDWNDHVYTTALRYLDLYDAQIKADDYYYTLRGINRKIENDNEVPMDMLWACDNLETVILPRTATKLCYEACYDMYSLKTLVIGDNTTYIDDDALGECRNLQQIIFLCSSKPEFDSDAFTDVTGNDDRKVQTMYVRQNMVQAFSNDKECRDHANNITTGFEDINQFRAYGCKAIGSEDDLASVTKLDGWFDNFPGITKLDNLDRTRITSIGKNIVGNLTNLQQLALPVTLTTIEKDAFKENADLHWIDLSDCDSLKSSLDTLGIGKDVLVYMPESFSSTATNRVTGKAGSLRCENYYLSDKFGYDVPKAFTAAKVTFGREFKPYTYSSITLPFDVDLSDMTAKFKGYAVDKTNTKSGEIHFTPTTTMKANTPYVVRAKTDVMEIEGDVSIPVTPSRLEVINATDYSLFGNLQALSAEDASGKMMAMELGTHLWNKSAQQPYTAYAMANSATASTKDVKSVFSDCNCYYYLGDEKYMLDGANTEEDPLFCAEFKPADGLDFRSEWDFAADSATYSREMTTTWGTLCLPYNYEADGNETCEFYEMKDKSDNSVTLTKLKGTVEAGRPVVVRRRNGVETVVISASDDVKVVKEAAEDAHLAGSFSQVVVPSGTYIINNDKFWLVGSPAVSKAKVNAYRSYISASLGAKATTLSITTDDETTAIDELNNMEDGNAEYYDAEGRRLDGLQRGLNIVKNGNRTIKVVIQ